MKKEKKKGNGKRGMRKEIKGNEKIIKEGRKRKLKWKREKKEQNKKSMENFCYKEKEVRKW